MRAPDFLVVGAARAGTTTLYQWLLEHPQVYVKPDKRPEPSFFLKSAEYAKGFEHYAQLFAAAAPDQVAGEASTSYLYHPVCAPRIAADLPGVKIVALLRHPADRAWSSYWHTRRHGMESLSFEAAIEQESEREAHPADPLDELRPHAYTGRSRYAEQIARLQALFPRADLYFGLFDDLVDDPLRVARGVFDFLGVDPEFRPPSVAVRLNTSTPREADFPAALRARMGQIFEPDIAAVEVLLGRALPAWRR